MNKIIEISRKEIGYTEKPFNRNKTKYGEWFGFQGVAWCGIFVSWVYHHAGYPLGNIGFRKGFAGCMTAVSHFKKTDEITDDPQPGDIVFFDFNGDKRYDHTGIFLCFTDEKKTHFYSVEGNTSISNQSNGGEVMEKKRVNKNTVFVHPNILDR